jgi:hypothetical protein
MSLFNPSITVGFFSETNKIGARAPSQQKMLFVEFAMMRASRDIFHNLVNEHCRFACGPPD